MTTSRASCPHTIKRAYDLTFKCRRCRLPYGMSVQVLTPDDEADADLLTAVEMARTHPFECDDCGHNRAALVEIKAKDVRVLH